MKKEVPATADNTRLALMEPFGKSAGSIPIFLKEGASRLRQSKTLSAHCEQKE